ncbi:Sodium/hydrogen exchanger family-domain-containing protein [Cyathus striatus]|nr:Sodium/hydrogen exchanger family-domain-containing protein [Cyathus striatus]
MQFSLPPTAVVAAVAASPSPTSPVAEEEEYYSSWSLFLVCILLILSLWTSYYLQIKRIRAVHETLVSIFAGMAVGLIVRLAPGTMIREMLTFKHTLFFNLLLPPIILNSGYELKQEIFSATSGRLSSLPSWGPSSPPLVWGLESLDLSLLECLTFGSTLSATDPVTILAIFNQYKVDPKLYTVIFGESLLNDAVSIVITLTQFRGTSVSLMSFFHGCGIFLLSFSLSTVLGIIAGLALSLLLKHSSLSSFHALESCLVALTAYTTYFLSNGLSLSGIVSLLFCGITLKHYAYHTMSRRTQRASKYLFQTLAQLSENFIFIYLGLALFTSAPTSEPIFSYTKPLFITITTISVVFTRYIAVFPLSSLINLVTRYVTGQRTEELPHSYQMMLFWAGLRGAVGVALAAGFKGKNAQILRTTVLVVVVLTVLLFGGTTARMLEILGIRTGVEDEEASSSDEEDAVSSPGTGRPWRSAGNGAGQWRWVEDEPTVLGGRPASAARIGSHYADPQVYNHHSQNRMSPTRGTVFSAASSDSYDSDAEVLPLAPHGQSSGPSQPSNHDSINTHPPKPNPGGSGVGEDSKWFQTIDERYLLPLFSNATASRTFHARRQRRTSGISPNSAAGSPRDSEDELFDGTEVDLGAIGRVAREEVGRGRVDDVSRNERGLPSPVLRSNSTGETRGGTS